MLTGTHNKNETPEHYELKQIAKLLLWDRGYKHIGTEVGGFHNLDPLLRSFGCWNHNTIDVIGARTNGWRNGIIPRITLMGMEAKASRADFRNGYCTACEYTYIIAPIGIVPLEELIPGVGLIEVDLSKYQIGSWNGIWHKGIETIVKAESRLASRFESKTERDKWAIDQFRRIAYRASVENVFTNARIEIMRKPDGEA